MVMRMPVDPKECREQARECLEFAEAAPSLFFELRFQGLAHSWIRLAREMEHSEVLERRDPKVRKAS